MVTAIIDGDTVRPLELDKLRELRLWHWNKVLTNSRYIVWCNRQGRPYTESQSYKLKVMDHANHMRFVQTLNDFFPVGDTAEKDAAK